MVEESIPAEEFYAQALKDKAGIASFKSVDAWLKDGSVILIDLRSADEFKEKHVKGAINLPATELTNKALSKVIPDKNSRVVIYCSNNLILHSRKLALTTMAYPAIKQLGYENVFILDSATRDQFPLPLVGSHVE